MYTEKHIAKLNSTGGVATYHSVEASTTTWLPELLPVCAATDLLWSFSALSMRRLGSPEEGFKLPWSFNRRHDGTLRRVTQAGIPSPKP